MFLRTFLAPRSASSDCSTHPPSGCSGFLEPEFSVLPPGIVAVLPELTVTLPEFIAIVPELTTMVPELITSRDK